MMTIGASLAAFDRWLAHNPLEGDRPFGPAGARYQVARYCDYLGANPWLHGNPLQDASARDAAVNAYQRYLDTFAPGAAIAGVLDSLDRFYVFLGLGPVVRQL
jgi:hypothetical protein